MCHDVELRVLPLGQANILEARQARAIFVETYQRELPAWQKPPQDYTTGIELEEECSEVSWRMSLLC